MHPTIACLLERRPVVTDGAWGTQLQARGLPVGACPDEWNLSHPERVAEVAAAYVAAGAQVILTNTFGANRPMLERHGLAERAAEINRRGAAISAAAARGKAKVFASIGPSGVLLMMGEVSEEQLHEAFLEQARALQEGGADGLVVETMGDLEEARVAVRAAQATGLPVVASMAFDAGAEKDRTMMGVTPEQAAAGLQEAGADVVGANCGQGIRGFHALCRRLRAATDLPLWMKANAGLPHLVDSHAVYDAQPEDFAREAAELADEGAAFVGGCCGTSPAFIRAIAARLGR